MVYRAPEPRLGQSDNKNDATQQPYDPNGTLLEPNFGPPIPRSLMLPSLEQTQVVAPRPLRPMPPPLEVSPPGPATGMRPTMDTQLLGQGPRTSTTVPGIPSQSNNLAQQQYERYHQQQLYQLELQRQNQEQDRMIQMYQQQQLQHRRQVLAQQAIMQKEHLSRLEFMQYQHQIHLLRSIRMQVRQQGQVRGQSGHEETRLSPDEDNKGKSKERDFDGYAELLQRNLEHASTSSVGARDYAAPQEEASGPSQRNVDDVDDDFAYISEASSEGSVATDSDDGDDDWDIPIFSRGDDDDVPYLPLSGRRAE
ncbi:hypothetical protein SEUCBS139899_008764 [Sporothrix eucalyptigena]